MHIDEGTRRLLPRSSAIGMIQPFDRRKLSLKALCAIKVMNKPIRFLAKCRANERSNRDSVNT